MDTKIEKKVADTVLQHPIRIKIGDETYEAAPPSVATLILASEAIANLPTVQTESGNMVATGLAVAGDCRSLGDVMAIMILGAKGITETRKVIEKRFGGLIRYEKTETIDRKSELAQKILEEMPPKELSDTLGKLIGSSQLAFFLGTIISLAEVNLLKRTKTATTVSGR